jgi:hypothetical protein
VLRFRIFQIYISSVHRYLLPLPKMTDAQLGILSRHLGARGFNVRVGGKPGRRIALNGSQRISIDGGLGLASSSSDMLDALGPAVPEMLAASTEGGKTEAGQDPVDRYLSLKSSGGSVELQFFPRLESLRMWTYLRTDGLSGLTPDEAAVIEHVLGRAASGSSRVRCVTAKPRRDSRSLQVGRRIYYETTMPVHEFLSSLRTIDSPQVDSASYLPRDSVFVLSKVPKDTEISPGELGEWYGQR